MPAEHVEISSLLTYPIKSCAGIELPAARLSSGGLPLDRTWMLVDDQGDFLNQLAIPALARIHPELIDEGASLRVHAPDIATPLTLTADAPTSPPETFAIYGSPVRGAPVSADADRWFTEALGVSCRLIRALAAPSRAVGQAHVRAHGGGEEVATRVDFADDQPLLMAHETSLEALNAELDAPVDMRRFRPNIIVRGGRAFDEDHWWELHHTSQPVSLLHGKPCVRCGIITVDPDTGRRRGPEPTRTLARLHTLEPGVVFGVLMMHRGQGVLAPGDRLEIRRIQ